MTAMEDDVDDRFAGIDIDSLLNRSDRRPFSLGRKKALYEAPEFIQRLNGEETVMEGQSICIECKIRGFPAPTLRWFKDDEEILDHPRIHVESTGTGTYALIIDNVNKGDEAAYRCRAENLEGQCSSYFFLSVRGKPKSPKKKGQNSSPNKRTVSFPPMFSTIVEKVEEEEKQGKELEKLPPSPMTEFYYALTLKGRQSWPTFVGDWAFANGGHSQKRRTDDEGSHSAPTTPIPNGDHNDRTFLSPSEARAAARRSLRRSELAARAEAKKQRLDEEAAKREKEQDEKQRKEEEERKKLEKEGEDKKNAEMKINMERQKREHAMRMRRKEREERLEREKKAQEEEKLEKERLEAEARQKANEKRKEEARLKEEKRLEEERHKQEEDKRKKEEQKKQEEVRRKEEERKKQEKEKKEKEKAEKKKRDEEARKSEVARKKKEAEEAERKQREEKEKEQKRLTEAKRKKEEEERARKEEEERKNKEAKQKLEEEQKKRGEARLKAEAEKQKQEEKKRQEDKSKLFTDRSETQLRKSPIEPVQEKPAGQKSVLQKFAKHLDSNLEPHAGTTPKHEPKALHLFQEKIDKAENAHNKIGDAKDIHKEKSPVRFGAGSSESLSSKNQQYRHAQTSDKSTDIPNEPQRSRGEDKTSLKPKPEQKVPNEKEINDSKLRPWQQRDKVVQKQEELKSKDQKSREDAAKERLEELRRKDQQRLEELKAAEQKRIDELKQKDRNPIGDLRRRELNQRETLRQKEQKQIEELRRKEQEQREALRQKEEKQREELRKREEKAKEELRASQPKEKKEPTPEEKQKAEEKLKKDREQLKVREVRQNEKLKVNETKQKEELHLKEVRQKEALKEKEKTQTEELKRREEKQLGELREKQQQQKSALQRTREEEEKKRKEQREREEQEELRRQYRKEQIRKEQLRRQHEEETKKRQQKQQEEAARRHAAKQNAEEDDEFQVKVYKRDYSFADLRKSLEAHVGGEVMDPEEHKYWDEILDKHNYSITDIRKAFDTSSSQSERPSRMRARRNSIEETEMLRMRRSSSISDLRESYTNSLDRPKKKKPSEPPRQKDEEFLKRASSITDIRKQFLDVVKKQTESTKPPGVSGRLEAEIAIHHLKPDSPLARFEGGRRSKSPASSRASFDSGRRSMSPVSSRYSPSPSPSPALETKQESTKPAPRAQSELTKLAASMAAKRASFHEMLQGGNPSTNSDKNMKRMSYHGSDSYGSRDIPTYRRAAGWSDDVEKSREIKNPDKIKPAEPKETTKNNPSSSKEDSRSGSETESSSSRVRPFIYNSARTIARNSTGSISSQNWESSSDDDVFSDEENYRDDKDDDRGPPAKKTLFYLVDDSITSSESDASPTEGYIVYNSNVIPSSTGQPHAPGTAHLQNKQNNNAPSGASKEALDNRGSSSKPETVKVDNATARSSAQASSNVQGDINDNSRGGRPLARVITGPAANTKGNGQAMTSSGRSRLQDNTTKRAASGNDTPNSASKIPKNSLQGNQVNPPSASNINVRCVNVIAPIPDGKGEITPPIVVEMWEEAESSAKGPKLAGNTSHSQQASLISTAKTSDALSAAACSREQREPTPFYKGSSSKGKETPPSPALAVPGTKQSSVTTEGIRTEREPTPYFDDKSKQTLAVGGQTLSIPGRNTSKDPSQDFQREPTPFFDKKKDTKQNVSHGNSLNVPGAASQNVRPPRESTPFFKDEDSSGSSTKPTTSTLAPPSSSLAVPTAGGVRDARESTPYYDEKDPYEYIHHPDHHFSEKKSVLVKQGSNEDEQAELSAHKHQHPVSASSLTSSSVSHAQAASPVSKHPETERKPPQTLPLRRRTAGSPQRQASDPAATSAHFTDSEQRRRRSARQTPPPEDRKSTMPSKIATLESPVKSCQSVISLIHGSNVTIDKGASVSLTQYQPNEHSSPRDANSQATTKRGDSKSNPHVTSSSKDSNPFASSVKTSEKSKDSSKSYAESTEQKNLPVSKTQVKPALSPADLQSRLEMISNVKSAGSLLRSRQSNQATAKPSEEQPTTAQSLAYSKAQSKIPVQDVSKLNTQSASDKLSQKQTIVLSSAQASVISKTVSGTSGIPLPANSRGSTPQKTAPLAVQESVTVETSVMVNAAKQPVNIAQSSQQASSSSLPPPLSARPKVKAVAPAPSSQALNKSSATKTTSEYEQTSATSNQGLFPSTVFTPAKVSFGGASVKQGSRMTATPPADTVWKKKESKASGISNALSSFLRPKRGTDSAKEKSSEKEKNKQGKNNPDGGKKKSRRTRTSAESQTAGNEPVVRDLSSYSPFGRYTTEGVCFLFVMALACLYLDTPIEKFVCYVLATFYTFCVLRILGLVE